ncbi:DNA sulfur modification protein DndB [Peribacillus sp. NPDC097206]|uniref:DNA sulfur modification protein DndB n=1 Tax=unclassified Peribacillus TaxID=2675266 RepID=UPI00380455E2
MTNRLEGIQTVQANLPTLAAATASITVPTIAYISGGRLWYALTIPYKTLGKFVQTSAVKKKNQVIIKADIKNRFLDKKHKDEIKEYIKEEEHFTIPPVTLVSYDKLTFKPFTFDSEEQPRNHEELMGRLEGSGSLAGIMLIPIDYEFECLDGNHRTVAIRELAEESPEYIAGSSMLLNIVYEEDKRKIRQDFVDVNKNAKKTSPSINTLFNTRDPLAGLVNDLFDNVNYLMDITELLATSVSKNSKDIYTLNNVKNVVIELAGRDSQSGQSSEKAVSSQIKDNEDIKHSLEMHATLFFEKLKNNHHIATCLANRDKTSEVRNDSIITSGMGIVIAARISGYILNTLDIIERGDELDRLMNFDWSRNNPLFLGKIVTDDGKLLVSREAINVAVKTIKKELGYTADQE